MDIVRKSRHQVGRFVALGGILLGTLAPAIAPVVASAATITTRSITLSSSATSATSDLEVKFNTSANVQSFDVTFCDAIDGTCNAPAGLAAGSVTAVGGGTIGTNTSNKIQVALASPVSTVDFEGAGLVNPSADGTIFARIAAYVSDDWTGGALDTGTVALAFTNGINVGGDVLETLTFCVSGEAGGGGAPTDCDAPTSPNVSLGTSGVLDTTAGSDVDVYALLATNASSGAVVNLKSDALGCGGLYRDNVSNATNCGISPINDGGAASALANGDAAFGAKLAVSGGSIAAGSGWSSTDYFMPWVSGDATGVTSTYGAEVFGATGPTDLGTATLSFNANAGALTPAGHYQANLTMIAVGKF